MEYYFDILCLITLYKDEKRYVEIYCQSPLILSLLWYLLRTAHNLTPVKKKCLKIYAASSVL